MGTVDDWRQGQDRPPAVIEDWVDKRVLDDVDKLLQLQVMVQVVLHTTTAVRCMSEKLDMLLHVTIFVKRLQAMVQVVLHTTSAVRFTLEKWQHGRDMLLHVTTVFVERLG